MGINFSVGIISHYENFLSVHSGYHIHRYKWNVRRCVCTMGNLNETIKLIRFIGVRTVGAKGGLATPPPPMFLQNRHHLGIQHWGVGLAPPPTPLSTGTLQWSRGSVIGSVWKKNFVLKEVPTPPPPIGFSLLYNRHSFIFFSLAWQVSFRFEYFFPFDSHPSPHPLHLICFWR